MLIGLMGYAKSGKDEVGKILASHGFRRVAFADPLKAIARTLGWNGVKDELGRSYLQMLGTTLRRELGADVFADFALRTLATAPNMPTVITDVRYLNEIDAIRGRGGVLWRVNRSGVGPANDHVSEREWTSIEPDATIDNSGTLEELRAKVEGLLNHTNR